jgi:TP901 family phage tail tape measure protein
MPATVRDILLMIRTKEEATKALNSISGAMRRASRQADIASARARSAALRAQAQQVRSAAAVQIANMRATGATVKQQQAVRDSAALQARALENSAGSWERQAQAIEKAGQRSENVRKIIQGTSQVAEVAGIAMLAGSAAMVYGMGKAVAVAAEWDKQVRLTYTQVDKKWKPSLAALSDIGLRTARDIATPFKGVQDALYDVFSSTEANLPQAEALLRSFAKAAVAGQTDIQTASRATIGLMNSYQIPFKDVNKVLDIQFKLVREGVGTYAEWAQRIGLVTPSAVRAGQSIETMAAALSTMTRLGTSSARASTSVARAFDAMSNPKTEKNLHKLGIATRDAKGNFRPLVQVLAEWRKELEKIPKKDRVAQILEVLKGAGGTIEARRFLQSMLMTKGGLELFQNQIKTFAKDKGSFQAAYNEMSNSVAAKTQLLKNRWDELKLGIGNALIPTFLKLVTAVGKLLTWFNKLSPKAQQMIAQFMVWSTVLGGVSGVVLLLTGALLGLAGIIGVAGSAILPIIAGMAVGIAVLAAITAGVIAFGVGIYEAYQKSASFRAIISQIGGALNDTWQIAKKFAVDLYNSFMTNVKPGLDEVWRVIDQKVLPAVNNFVAYCRSEFIPALKAAGLVIIQEVTPRLKELGDWIKNYLAPALSDLVDWWNRNKGAIMPLIGAMASFIVIAAVVVGFLIGNFIGALIMWSTILISSARMASAAWHAGMSLMKGSIDFAVNAVKAFIRWIKQLASDTKNNINLAKNAIKAGVDGIKAVFAGAPTMLLNAGRQIVAGLINGIKGGIGGVKEAAKSLVGAAIGAAKANLKIGSPSRVFKDIGMNVIRGFVNGVTGGRKKILDTMFALSRDISRAINGSKVAKSTRAKYLKKYSALEAATQKKLLALDVRRTALTTRLTAATKDLNDQIKARADLQEAITNTLQSQSDILSLDDAQKTNTASMISGLKDRLKALTTFQANLLTLSKRGFDRETIADLAGKGVDAAGAMVATLATASQDDLNQITSLQQQIRTAATATAGSVASQLYDAGIAASKGLIAGLQSQIGAITKSMTAIANALVKQIKHDLGIHSPSTVFDKLGRNTGQGYINGYINQLNNAKKAMSKASAFTPANPSPGRVGAGGYTSPMVNAGTSNTKQITNHINVHTQEIDPRKSAADLGWELAGRM